MKIVFISGPYRDEDPTQHRRNIARAMRYAAKWWSEGCTVICLHGDEVFRGAQLTCAQRKEAALDLLNVSDVCVMLPGWERSEGSRGEYEFAVRHWIEVIYE